MMCNPGLLTAVYFVNRVPGGAELLGRYPEVGGACVEQHLESLAGRTDSHGSEVVHLWTTPHDS